MDKAVDNIPCKVCKSLDVSILNISNLPVSAHPFSCSPTTNLAFDTSLFICQDCGHMYLDVPPVSYYKNVIRSVSVSSEMATFRRNQFRSLLSLFSKPSSQIRVLEIGAGNGQYSQLLSEVFSNCFATEPNSSSNLNSGFQFINTHPDNGDFEEIMKTYGNFDLICCFSYLEHLPNPHNTLLHISQLLSPDGFALLEVPNCDYIRKKSLLCEVIPDHLHYFSSRSLVTLAHQSNLSLHSLNSIWSNYIISCVFQKSEESQLVLSRFATSHDKFLAQIDEQVSLIASNKKIAVWGAGHQSLFILASSRLAQRVDFVLDSSVAKQEKYIPGINKKISNPSILQTHSISLLFVICAGYNSEVVSSIKSMKLPYPLKVFSISDNQLHEEFL